MDSISAQGSEFEKMLEALKERIDRLKSEKEDKNRVLRRLIDEVRNANSSLEHSRREYQEILNQYDFIDDLEELEKTSVNPTEQSQAAQGGDMDEGSQTRAGMKRSKMNFDFRNVFSLPVTKNLAPEQLEDYLKYIEEIKVKLTWHQERLKTIQPNLNSINEYKIKVIPDVSVTDLLVVQGFQAETVRIRWVE
jgi:chromosome segregation ATPase